MRLTKTLWIAHNSVSPSDSGGRKSTNTEKNGMGMIEQILENQDKIMAMLAEMQGGTKESKPAEKAKPAAKPKATDKAAPKKAAPKKEEPAESDFTAEDVRQRFLAIQGEHGDDVAKAAIQHFGKKKLAEIIGDAESWDNVMEVSASILETGEIPEEDEAEEEDNGGL